MIDKRVWVIAALAAAMTLGYAAVGLADPGHGRGDPHRSSTATVTLPAATSTQTVTVQQPAAPAGSSTSSATASAAAPAITVVVQPGQVVVTRTITKVVQVKLRRWCTRQRHGWVCTSRRPK